MGMLRLPTMPDQERNGAIDPWANRDDAGREHAPFRYRVPVLGWLKPLGLSATEQYELRVALRAHRSWFADKVGPSTTMGACILILVLPDLLSSLILNNDSLALKLITPRYGVPLGVIFILNGWLWIPPTNPPLFRHLALSRKRCPTCMYRIDRSAKDACGRRICSECGHVWWIPGEDAGRGQMRLDHTTSPPHTTTSTGFPPNS